MSALPVLSLQSQEETPYASVTNARAFTELQNIATIKKIFEGFRDQIDEWKKRSAETVQNWKREGKEEKNREFEIEFRKFMGFKKGIDEIEKSFTLIRSAVLFSQSPPVDPFIWDTFAKLPIDCEPLKKLYIQHLVEEPAELRKRLEPLETDFRSLSQQLQAAKMALEPWAAKVKEKSEKTWAWQFTASTAKYVTGTTTYMERLIAEYEPKSLISSDEKKED